jgi:uncharacterized membrane protein YphA (DoxX/SURF4 family)
MAIKTIHWCCRLFLAAMFIYAGYTKLDNELQFAAAVEAYKLLAAGQVMWVVYVLPRFEILLGIALLVGPWIRYSAAFTAAFLGFFILVMLVTYLRGIEADCGCFGIGERISPRTLLRDSLFTLPAVFLAVQPWVVSRLSRGRRSQSAG